MGDWRYLMNHRVLDFVHDQNGLIMPQTALCGLPDVAYWHQRIDVDDVDCPGCLEIPVVKKRRTRKKSMTRATKRRFIERIRDKL